MIDPKSKMPVLFLAHGTPMNALEDNMITKDWQSMIIDLPKPDAVVCISAHWETRGTYITTAKKPGTLHDFGGFPQALFDIEYACPGAPELARKIINQVDLTTIQADPLRQLDHGVWSLMLKLFPLADIPTIQLSLDVNQEPEFHFQLGRQLSFLRKQNILLISSGNIVHNIRKWMKDPDGPMDWSIEFDNWVYQSIQRRDLNRLLKYETLAPYAHDAVPTPEHFTPLLYCLGAQNESDRLHTSAFIAENPESSAMRSIRWG
jgi:4,5-DOPA dioxygenase extradiol